MAKMVEIEKLLEAVRMLSTTFYSYHTLTRILDELPIIDTVEVVRCKDCRFYWKNNRDSDVPVCLASPKDDAFCSEGERR